MRIWGKVMIQKGLAVAVILLFVGTCIIPSATSELTNSKRLTNGKNIITVDDEPGDADFTSIKEAVNYSSPGDIIEVYSGTYPEEGIRIEKDDITLRGISHELGEGNDSGKPFIKGDGTAYVIKLIASYVTVSNFIIENPWSEVSYHYSCIRVGTDWPDELYNITISNCIISDCIIRNSTSRGISVVHTGQKKNITIINNHISHCRGIFVIKGIFIISGNVITDCNESGIYLKCALQNVSWNRIRRCRIGIAMSGDKNIVYGNDIESCDVGISYGGNGNFITKNNFKNYSRIGFWFGRNYFWGLMKSRWIGNYWDTWIGVGPKIILGLQAISYMSVIPGFEFDWHPAKEPYDIP